MVDTTKEVQPSLFDIGSNKISGNQPRTSETQSPLVGLQEQERAVTRQLERLEKVLEDAVETGTHGDVPGTKAQIVALESQLQEIHSQRDQLSAGIKASLVKSTSSSEK